MGLLAVAPFLLLVLLFSTTFCQRSRLRSSAQASPPADPDRHSDGLRSGGLSSVCPPQCAGATPPEAPGGGGARVFYLVVVHNNRTLQDAVHLLRAVRDPRNIVAVHVDRKAVDLLSNRDSVLHREVAQCSCGSRVLIESVYDVKWSEWSMNLPTLWGMELAVKEYAGQWDVFINLSGDTLPVLTPNAMASILQDLPYNFVTSSSCETGLRPTNVYTFPSFWHKRRHYTQSDSLPDPTFRHIDPGTGEWRNTTLQTHFGSQWMILRPEFCTWLVHQLEEPSSLASQFRDYLVDNGFLMTDETFFSSLLAQVDAFVDTLPRVDDEGNLLWKNTTASSIRAVRYERMDENIPSAFGYVAVNQRYDVPNNSAVDRPRPWGPYFLGVYDLASVRDTGALFIRKVSDQIDFNMVRLFPVDHSDRIPDISWPEFVAISDKPNWEKLRELMIARQAQVQSQGNQDSEMDDQDSETDDDEEL